MLVWCARRCVNEQVVQCTPVDIFQELGYETVFLGTSPHDGILRWWKHESNWHDAKIILNIYRRPAGWRWMNLLGRNSKDCGYRGTTDIDVHNTGLEGGHQTWPHSNGVWLTCRSSSAANAHPNWAVNVDFPTPPFPDRTRIFRLTPDIRSVTKGRAGSGPRACPDAHISWLAHPAHASDFPASSESVPWV